MTNTVLFLLTVIAIMTQSLHSLKPLGRRQHRESSTNKLLQVLMRLANLNIGRERRQNDYRQQKAKTVFNLLTKTMDPEKVKELLREGTKDDTDVEDETINVEPIKIPGEDGANEKRTSAEHAEIVENELTTALKEQSSALLSQPYVEQKGKNDFLVMKDNVTDPFVTVIPNAIYYNIEKKCVNWLDDCSMDGLRAKLFQAVRSPFK